MKKLLLSFFCFLLLASCSSGPTADNINSNNIILCLGDSLTYGYNVGREETYPSKLSELLTGSGYTYEVINAGNNGDTSDELVKKIDDILARQEKTPTIAILTIGGNDALRKLSTENLKKNIETLIEKLTQKHIVVVLGGIKLEGLAFGFSYTQDFNKVHPQVAKATNVFFVKNFLEGIIGNSSFTQSDFVHPNAQGYTIISKNIFTFLEKNKLIQK